MELFERALRAFRERRFDSALGLFCQVLALAPGDAASRLFIERCEHFQKVPPPPGWNGVSVMTTKG